MITDRRQPVAILGPVPVGLRYVRRAVGQLDLPVVAPLTDADPDALLDAERGDR